MNKAIARKVLQGEVGKTDCSETQFSTAIQSWEYIDDESEPANARSTCESGMFRLLVPSYSIHFFERHIDSLSKRFKRQSLSGCVLFCSQDGICIRRNIKPQLLPGLCFVLLINGELVLGKVEALVFFSYSP